MKVTREDVIYCANLAQISLSENEIDSLREDMANFINYVHNLDQLDLDNVDPYVHRNNTSLLRRKDIQNEEINDVNKSILVANAPRIIERYFVVPSVM